MSDMSDMSEMSERCDGPLPVPPDLDAHAGRGRQRPERAELHERRDEAVPVGLPPRRALVPVENAHNQGREKKKKEKWKPQFVRFVPRLFFSYHLASSLAFFLVS